ncbi:peptide chain release factor N(5)-glutamine methyltransferase [Fulvivirgaceae bacterium BMA10]|uniref:peptide chain release factor N(5)-glutamine methyltransferase n=1 Tax=Splendidivirga corallicola TaxID=3051826 RepID=A0ABT8KM40_9BACT|nr:peptide chain release factor N(5)-glutamine methyltransferase [Fulvivirgaceae bacterium BMA10]
MAQAEIPSSSKQLYHYIFKELDGIVPEREIDSIVYLILEYVWELNRTDVVVDKMVEEVGLKSIELENIIFALKRQEPIQYILGRTEFYGRTFYVDQKALIPRPETEELVDLVIRECVERSPKILDIGTGTGCIPITIKEEILNAEVYGLDVSEDCILLAEKNAVALQSAVIFYQCNILNSQLPVKDLDIIVSNPPYVRESEKSMMSRNVLDYEPHLALFVKDDDPLVFYRSISKHARKNLKKNGKLYFEINEAFGNEVKHLMEQDGFKDVLVVRDMQRKDRIVRGSKI